MTTGFNTLGSAVAWIEKRPGELKDYYVDYTDDLAEGETLSSVAAAVGTGITLASPAPTINAGPVTVKLRDGTTTTIAAGKAAVVWLSGGAVGDRPLVTVTCPQGARILQRNFEVRIVL